MERIEVGTVLKFENGNEAVVTDMWVEWVPGVNGRPDRWGHFLHLVNKAQGIDQVGTLLRFIPKLARPPFGDQSKADELAGGKYQCPFCQVDITAMIDEDQLIALQVDSFECPGCGEVVTTYAASEIMVTP